MESALLLKPKPLPKKTAGEIRYYRWQEERKKLLDRPAFKEFLPYLDERLIPYSDKIKEIIKRTPIIEENNIQRIRKQKQIKIEGWGYEMVIKIDFYFKELTGKRHNIIESKQEDREIGHGDEIVENAYVDVIQLRGDVSHAISIFDFDFNNKNWKVEYLEHFVRMGYLDGSRLSLSNILWDEGNITWSIWKPPSYALIKPDDCHWMLPKERWGSATIVYDCKKPRKEKEYCKSTGISPYDINNYIPSKKQRKMVVKGRVLSIEQYGMKII